MSQPESNAASPNLALDRHARLYRALARAGLEALILNPGPSMVYLTGMHFHLSERPVTAIFRMGQPVTFVVAQLESAKLEAAPFSLQAAPYGEQPETWQRSFDQAVQLAGLGPAGALGVEFSRMRLLEHTYLKAALPQAAWAPAEEVIAALRMYKDAGEVAAMRRAAQIAEAALQATLPMIAAGRTEREIAGELTQQLMRHGSDSELPFTPIVSSGPNSANPHAFPGERCLQPGDLLVIDWGASYHGYYSDITRTFAIGEVSAEFERIHALTQAANAAGRAAAGPEVLAEQVDRAARQVIEAGGYGEYFIHRTGHGLGLEGHEPPYIRSGNPVPLSAGMTFTIEPGIYLPGRGGVRIEDDVVVTAGGVEVLTSLPRELIRLG